MERKKGHDFQVQDLRFLEQTMEVNSEVELI